MRLTLFAVALLLTARPVVAGEFPIYDVESQCRAAYTGIALASCIREDQAGYDFARAFWADLPEASQRRCTEMRKPPSMKYVQLQSCVQTEMRMNQGRPDAVAPPRFRY